MHTYTYHPNSTGSIKILQHYTYFPFFSNSKEDFIMYLFLLLHWVLGVECEIFLLHRGMRDLPWQGIEPAPPTLRVWSRNHWTTRESISWQREACLSGGQPRPTVLWALGELARSPCFQMPSLALCCPPSQPLPPGCDQSMAQCWQVQRTDCARSAFQRLSSYQGEGGGGGMNGEIGIDICTVFILRIEEIGIPW